jgi:cytochrome c556
MKSLQSLLKLAVPVLIFLASVAGSARAENDEAFIQYRQKIMTANVGNCGAIGDILKNQLPYSKDRIAEHARLLHGNIGMISSAFKQKTADLKTDAKPGVWQDWAKFEDKIKAIDAEVGKLEQVAASGTPQEIGDQFKKVAGGCKSCHDDFRKPKEESWKK